MSGDRSSPTSSDSVLYVLPKPDFFAKGRRGRVTHAIGVANGLSTNGIDVRVLSGSGLSLYSTDIGAAARIEEVDGGGRLWLRRLRARIAALLREDIGVRHIIIRYAVSNGARFLSLMDRFPDRRWVFEVNSLGYHQYGTFPSPLRRRLLAREQKILGHAHSLYVVSQRLRADLCSGRGSIPEARIVVAPNAGNADLARLAVRSEERADGAKKPGKFVYLGMFHGYYDFEFVLEAFRRLVIRRPEAELHFFGDGERLRLVRSLARHTPNTHFHGRYNLMDMVERGEVGREWILLLPYRPIAISTIGSPTKLFEYMALGRPILASAHGQPSEILEDDVTGSIYDANHVDDLVGRMERLLDHPETCVRMGEAARSTFLRKHTWPNRMAELWKGIQTLS